MLQSGSQTHFPAAKSPARILTDQVVALQIDQMRSFLFVR
jgi:hypothetical protein